MQSVNRAIGLLIIVALATLLIGPSANAQAPIGMGVSVTSTARTQAALGSSIPYQGQLKDNGAAANGVYDFQFKLYDDASAGNRVGSAVNQEDVAVANGLFSVALDFGGNAFNGEARYLEIGVRPGASTAVYTTLAPRRSLLPSPYAQYSNATRGLSVDGIGFVGIGTAAPKWPLHVFAQDAGVGWFESATSDSVLFLVTNEGLDNYVGFANRPGGRFGIVTAGAPGGLEAFNILRNGYVGIGVPNPTVPLQVQATSVTGEMLALQSRTKLSIMGFHRDNSDQYQASIGFHTTSNNNIAIVNFIDGGHIILSPGAAGGRVGIGTSEPRAQLEVNGTTYLNGPATVNGLISANIVQITGGDLAEPFEIDSADTVRPGMVVAIDPDNPGQMRLSTSAYNRTVAGVISGAGGIEPGVVMYKDGANEDTRPVALSGRVYVWADASNGAIAPGDLLTTSATPGHAMKVTDHERAQGAILGKAMSKLAKGTGLVLILVTLQ